MIKNIFNLIVITIISFSSFAQEVDVTLFSKHARFKSIKISPTGHYYAATFPYKKHTRLAILKAEDFSLQCQFYFDDHESINNFWWGNDDRLLMSIYIDQEQFATPAATGELFAGNADCSKQTALLGYRSRHARSAGSQIVSRLPDDKKHILIANNERKSYLTDIYKLNIYTGRKKMYKKGNISHGSIILDNDMQWRLSYAPRLERAGITRAQDTGDRIYFYRATEKDEWQPMFSSNRIRSSAVGYVEVIGFSEDNQHIYLLDNTEHTLLGLYKFNPETQEKTLMYRHDVVDSAPFFLSLFDEKKQMMTSNLVGTSLKDGLPSVHFFDENSKAAKEYRSVAQSFPNEDFVVTSSTRDGHIRVIQTYSDRNPGTYYLYNVTQKKIEYLLPSSPWINPEQMAKTQAIQVKSRDGLTLHGFLTLPNGSDGKNLPMIMHPHGGPFGITDSWGFNPEVQLYAAAGYAVLQINFRGSGGYGREFEDLGYGSWAGSMQDDLTDSTLWAIEQGIADKDRICISGASYGGYSALMSVIREPDLYQCSIGYVGVYDLNLMMNRGNVAERIGWGTDYMSQAFGSTKEERTANSPATHADKIKAAVFLVHGGQDLQAHYENAYVMADALKAAGKEFEWLFTPDEGHGFYGEDNNTELYRRMLAFLDQHIGTKSKVKTQVKTETSQREQSSEG